VDIQKLKAASERARAQLTTSNQSVHATASAVAELRDAHLARQVLELCHATLDMWRAMRQHHEAQAAVAQQLRGLSSRTSMDPTTEIHHEATRALESAMGVWHAATAHVARHQREYVHAVHGWLKLTLTPVAQEASSSPVAAELAAFVDRWGEVLDRVHCVEVMKSIRSVAGAARVLYGLQSDELKVARRVRHYSRELDRKSRMLRQVEKSYYDSYMPGGFSLWQRGREDVRQAREAQHEVAQRKDDITACRKTLEDEMRRHAKAIDATRSATVSSVQGKLPAVFQAVAAYSASLANALDAVCRPPQNAPTQ
jgi:chromosome segregation ATPase